MLLVRSLHTAAGNITLEHKWFPRIFSEMRLEIGSQQLEIINEPGTPFLLQTPGIHMWAPL